MGTGSVLECQNGTKLINMEFKGHQKRPKASKMEYKRSQFNNMDPKAPKLRRKAIHKIKKTMFRKGRLKDVSLFSGYMSKDDNFGSQHRCQTSSKVMSKQVPKHIMHISQNHFYRYVNVETYYRQSGFDGLEVACANGKGRYQQIINILYKLKENYIEHYEKQSECVGKQIESNRCMERQMVEKVLQNNERGVRITKKGSLDKIKKPNSSGFGGQVITHASRPEGPANYIQSRATST